MLTYATEADLLERVNPAPENAGQLLRSASLLVSRATRTAVYDIDAAGMPTGDVAEAMRDATVAQAATWHALDVDPVKGAAGQAAVVSSKSIKGASIGYDTSAVTAARGAAVSRLCDEATLILMGAGLMPSTVQVHG